VGAPVIVGKVLPRAWGPAGTARPQLPRISGARKSAVAVAEDVRRAQCPCAPIAAMVSSATKRRDGPKATSDRITKARDPHIKSLPPHSNAIDTPVPIAGARCSASDRGTRHWTRPKHDTGPCDATCRIANIRAIYNRLGGCRSESGTCKPQQDAGCNSRNCR